MEPSRLTSTLSDASYAYFVDTPCINEKSRATCLATLVNPYNKSRATCPATLDNLYKRSPSQQAITSVSNMSGNVLPDPMNIEAPGTVTTSAAGSSTDLTIPDRLPGDINFWNPGNVCDFLRANKDRHFLRDLDIEIIESNYVAGMALLELTKNDLLKEPYSLKGGPATVIAKLVEKLKENKGLIEHAGFYKKHKTSLHEAIDRLGLMAATLTNSRISLSKLTIESKMKVLELLGEELTEEDPFLEIFKTTRTFHDLPSIIANQTTRPFPIVGKPKLYVREAYRDIYPLVLKKKGRILLTGSSGVGKSCFLVYLVIRLLVNSDKGPVVLFQPQKNTAQHEFYCYTSKSVRGGTLLDFRDFLNLSEIWYLADGITSPQIVPAKTIVALSPKSLATKEKNDEFQEFDKRLMNILYMPPWSGTELEDCRKNVFPDVNADLMEQLYEKVGGIPRYVLNDASLIMEKGSEHLRRLDNAIRELGNPAKLLECLRRDGAYVQYSSRLLHLWPESDTYERARRKWASAYVEQEILRGLNEQSWKALLKDLTRSTYEDSRGIQFESYTHYVFRTGGHTFKVRSLQRLNETTFQIPYKPCVKLIRKPTDLSKCTEPTQLIVPSMQNFPAVDLILTPNSLFQVTISKSHAIKQKWLVDIIENMPAFKNQNMKFRLYFVVPNDIYDDFQKQNYLNDNNEVSQRVPLVLTNCVEQYALKIDIEAAANGRSPGV